MSFSTRFGQAAAVAALLSLSLFGPAHAQTLSASGFVGAGLDFDYIGGSDPGSHTETITFTGMDSAGNTQTMTFTGTGSATANYGRLGAFAHGIVTNPYYNASNPLYFDGNTLDKNGSPNALLAQGQARFVDTFTYTGLQGTGYNVRYIFAIDGLSTGTTAGLGGAFINFTAGSDPTEVFGTSDRFATFGTTSHSVLWGTPFTIDTFFFVQFNQKLDTNDPSFTEGETIEGTADYSSTLRLTGIEITDPTGKPASGWSLVTASGATYPLVQGSAAVPEPGSLALLIGAGFCGTVLLRRRQRATT